MFDEDDVLELAMMICRPGGWFNPGVGEEAIVSNYPGQTAKMQELYKKQAREFLTKLWQKHHE